MKILDIGANDGWWYLHNKDTYPDAKFILIEANPNNESSLKKLGVEYYIKCLSDSVKQVDFYITSDSPSTTGASYYLENTHHFNNSNIQILKLETTTLDLLFPNETFDIIKMDVQGAEVDIIKGGINLIKQAKQIILEVPIDGVEYNINAPNRKEYFDIMNEIGFSIYEVLDNINNIHEDIKFIK